MQLLKIGIPAMMYDLKHALTDEIGNPVYRPEKEKIEDKLNPGTYTEVERRVVTNMGDVVYIPLLAEHKEDAVTPGKEKLLRYDLAMRIVKHDKNVLFDMSVTEANMLKKYVERSFKILWYGQFNDWIEHPIGKSETNVVDIGKPA